MIDIYSPFVVGVAEHAHESGPPAVEMMKECFRIHGIPAGGQPCVHHCAARRPGRPARYWLIVEALDSSPGNGARRSVMSNSVVTDLGSNFVGSPGTASWHACTQVPTAAPDDLVSQTLDGMRGRRFDTAAAVAVLDNDRFVGVANIERMFAAPKGARVRDVMDSAPPVVAPDTDQEHAAWQAVQRSTRPGRRRREGRFRGLIAPQQLLSVLLQEHDEDMARFGGFLHSVESTRATSLENVARRLWHRMPWLLVGLLGAMVSAGLMAAFEAQLDANLAVAYFVPGIVYLADAVGTQTETLAIRGLVEIPRFTRRAYSRMARPSAPLWVENATRPAGGNTGEKVAFSSTLGSAFSSPMQLGPIMRAPASRTIVRSSASRARPSTPVSEKPALMTTSALTCFTMASWTTAETLAAGTAITARSMSPGTLVSRGYAVRPCSAVTSG